MKHNHQKTGHYRNFGIMIALSFIAMYFIMYAMVYRFSDVIFNINQVYMVGLMTIPMILFELFFMRSMYMNKKKNMIIAGISIILAIFFWFGIREQLFVSDTQFLKSMIPHHSGAILMCERSDLTHSEIRELCEKIIQGQDQEIQLMQELLNKKPL